LRNLSGKRYGEKKAAWEITDKLSANVPNRNIRNIVPPTEKISLSVRLPFPLYPNLEKLTTFE
jgi:hypothetical protein